MIKKHKQESALKALQAVIIRARTMSYENEDHRKIADILDGAEYLTALIYNKEDQTDAFGNYLQDIAKKHNCFNSLELFDE